jgi:hypothetical protein
VRALGTAATQATDIQSLLVAGLSTFPGVFASGAAAPPEPARKAPRRQICPRLALEGSAGDRARWSSILGFGRSASRQAGSGTERVSGDLT